MQMYILWDGNTSKSDASCKKKKARHHDGAFPYHLNHENKKKIIAPNIVIPAFNYSYLFGFFRFEGIGIIATFAT